MIRRLRPQYSKEMLAELYAEPYDSTKWDEHNNRVEWTIRRINTFMLRQSDIKKGVDLSCGDGRILSGIIPLIERVYGDVVNAPHLTVPNEDIMDAVQRYEGDIFICSETLEHLDRPDVLLNSAAKRYKWIVITTPVGEQDSEKNYEHLWGWDLWGLCELFDMTGWIPHWVDTFNQPYYTYQFWIARSIKC